MHLAQMRLKLGNLLGPTHQRLHHLSRLVACLSASRPHRHAISILAHVVYDHVVMNARRVDRQAGLVSAVIRAKRVNLSRPLPCVARVAVSEFYILAGPLILDALPVIANLPAFNRFL